MGKRLKLGEMLVAKGLVSAAQLDAALAEQRRWGKRLGMTLVLMGFLEEETLIRTLAAQLKLPVARIRGKRVNAEVVELVPVELAEKHRCLPLFVKHQDGARELYLAMEDPSDLDAQGELGFRIGFRIRPVLVAPTELEDALQRHYHWSALMGQIGDTSDGFAPLHPSGSAAPNAPEDEHEDRLREEPSLPPQEPVAFPDAADGAFGDAPDGTFGDAPDGALGDAPDEPFEDTEPELHAAASALAVEKPGDTQPDPPDIERAAEELGAFGETAAPASAPSARPAARAAAPPMSADVILRALSQLLVEKGVLTRDELVERLRTLAARDAGDGTQS